jgi:hypothetical protein
MNMSNFAFPSTILFIAMNVRRKLPNLLATTPFLLLNVLLYSTLHLPLPIVVPILLQHHPPSLLVLLWKLTPPKLVHVLHFPRKSMNVITMKASAVTVEVSMASIIAQTCPNVERKPLLLAKLLLFWEKRNQLLTHPRAPS